LTKIPNDSFNWVS